MVALLWIWLAALAPDPVRDGARVVLEARCGKCHDGAQATAKPAALAIFDLHEDDWPARLHDAQLPKLLGRLVGMGAPADERARVSAFVDAERKRRGAH